MRGKIQDIAKQMSAQCNREIGLYNADPNTNPGTTPMAGKADRFNLKVDY
jgi:hypothetical protein